MCTNVASSAPAHIRSCAISRKPFITSSSSLPEENMIAEGTKMSLKTETAACTMAFAVDPPVQYSSPRWSKWCHEQAGSNILQGRGNWLPEPGDGRLKGLACLLEQELKRSAFNTVCPEIALIQIIVSLFRDLGMPAHFYAIRSSRRTIPWQHSRRTTDIDRTTSHWPTLCRTTCTSMQKLKGLQL